MTFAMRFLLLWSVGALAVCSKLPAASVRIGVIGDYGSGTTNEEAVANLVKSWQPDFIMTVGDNNYPYGEATTIDQNVGKFFHDYIYPYTGAYGAGAVSNRFFPTVGNHDCCFPRPRQQATTLTSPTSRCPGKERYYNYRYGPVEIFCLNSNPNDPDGWTFDSVQGEWLRTSLANSTATWRLVYFHHSPWSSGSLHGTSTWPGLLHALAV